MSKNLRSQPSQAGSSVDGVVDDLPAAKGGRKPIMLTMFALAIVIGGYVMTVGKNAAPDPTVLGFKNAVADLAADPARAPVPPQPSASTAIPNQQSPDLMNASIDHQSNATGTGTGSGTAAAVSPAPNPLAPASVARGGPTSGTPVAIVSKPEAGVIPPQRMTNPKVARIDSLPPVKTVPKAAKVHERSGRPNGEVDEVGISEE